QELDADCHVPERFDVVARQHLAGAHCRAHVVVGNINFAFTSPFWGEISSNHVALLVVLIRWVFRIAKRRPGERAGSQTDLFFHIAGSTLTERSMTAQDLRDVGSIEVMPFSELGLSQGTHHPP